MILVFGSINVDLVARVARIPRPGETVLSPRHDTFHGGKGANQAVAAARVLPPGSVVMAGAVGDDAFGRAARANLADAGVSTACVGTVAAPTGCAFIAVDAAGENAITVASGANALVEADMAAGCPVDAATVAVLQMEVPLAASLAVARRVRAAGGRTVWNLAPAPDDLAASDLRALLAATDVLVVNAHEATAAARCLGLAAADAEAAAASIAAETGVTVIVTLGAAGAAGYGPGGVAARAVARRVVAVDTTGAGDTFVGVLAAALAEGCAPGPALERATVAATLACLGAGAQPAMPTRAALEAALAAGA